MDLSEWSAVVIGVLGVAGLIYTALSWRRNDTTAIVEQQDTIMGELKDLTAELRTQRDECLAKLAARAG